MSQSSMMWTLVHDTVIERKQAKSTIVFASQDKAPKMVPK